MDKPIYLDQILSLLDADTSYDLYLSGTLLDDIEELPFLPENCIVTQIALSVKTNNRGGRGRLRIYVIPSTKI